MNVKFVPVTLPTAAPSLYRRYPATPTSSVDGDQDSVTAVRLTPETETPVGIDGGVVSLGGAGATGAPPPPPPQGPGTAVTVDWAEALPAASTASTPIVTGAPHGRFPTVSGLVPWPSNSTPPTYTRYAATPTSSIDGSHHTLADDGVTPTTVTLGALGAVTSGPAPAVVLCAESVAPKRWTDGDPSVDTGATARSTAREAAAEVMREPQSWSLNVL